MGAGRFDRVPWRIRGGKLPRSGSRESPRESPSAGGVILKRMISPENPEAAAGISRGPAPTPVGEYAAGLVRDLRRLPRATVTGELSDVRTSRVQVYFQLRDDRGGVPCTMWRDAFERLDLPPEALRDGAQVIATGGPDYYVGGKHASPSFSFRVTELRPAGEGDLLARLAALRRQFADEGLLEPQKRLHRPALPRRIGVITAEGGAARQDLMVGLERRGWQGEVVWGFAPVQDRKAAPVITRTLGEMAAFGDVEAIVVCRGGGSLTDLWAFCDENLCRTVAMLAVPVISAVGHERDVTLLDEVAAVRCSTPTHAAEAVIRVDCNRERAELRRQASSLQRCGLATVRDRVAPLASLAAGPGRAIRHQRGILNQKIREVRASADRGLRRREGVVESAANRHLTPVAARAERLVTRDLTRNARLPARVIAAAERNLESRQERERTRRVAVRAHDPQRTLERGYARVEDRAGEPVVDPAGARKAGDVRIRFADGPVDARVGAPVRKRRARSTAARSDGRNEFEQIKLEGIESDD